VPGSFSDQLAILEALLREVERMERGEKAGTTVRPADAYERELRLAGLAQRVAQAYTIIEGVLAFVARRLDRAPLAGEDWHRKLVERCSQPFADPARPALLSAALAEDLLELCEFRHVVGNIYPTRLDEARVQENLERLIRAARTLDAQARSFAAGLRAARKRRRGRTLRGR
jgi:hypothetical protein